MLPESTITRAGLVRLLENNILTALFYDKNGDMTERNITLCPQSIPEYKLREKNTARGIEIPAFDIQSKEWIVIEAGNLITYDVYHVD